MKLNLGILLVFSPESKGNQLLFAGHPLVLVSPATVWNDTSIDTEIDDEEDKEDEDEDSGDTDDDNLNICQKSPGYKKQ